MNFKHKPDFRGDRGAVIAKILFPELALEPKGSFDDRYGIDGRINGKTVQIKYDSGILKRDNLWHEIYEKSDTKTNQPWRKSPGIATHYIFTTESDTHMYGFFIATDTLCESEIGKSLQMIRPNGHELTSAGFFLPFLELNNCFEKRIKELL